MADSITRYWCYLCERVVDPIRIPEVKCSICDSGFVEEMNPGTDIEPASYPRSERHLSLWAPILLGMTGAGNSTRSNNTTGFRRFGSHNRELEEADDEVDQELLDFNRRRRRRSAVRQLLHILREESETRSNQDRERNRELERERTSLLISAFNQAMALQGNSSSNPISTLDLNPSSSSSLEDYFIGPGLDILLQHLTENDPSRYGTLPAKKEAVAALPSVKIEDSSLACSVCLDEFEIGSEAKLLPCKHKFHGKCILPWLELHCSCPVCRFELPANESKDSSGESSGSGARNAHGDGNDDDDGVRGSGNTDNDGVGVSTGNSDSNNRPWVLMQWPFNSLFSMSGSRSGGGSSPGNGSNANSDEN